MKKLLFVVSCAFLSTNIAASTSNVDPNIQMKFYPNELGLADSVMTQHLKVVPGQIYGFKNYPKEKARLLSAFDIIEAVINSESFKEQVINFAGSTGNGYSSNRSLTNAQVYEFLMQGKELLNGANTLGEMNFNVERYYRRWSKVIGYTSPGKHDWIAVNGKFYAGYDVAQMASNITHEWIHLNGFYHDSARDHDSVPYAVGYIMEDLAKKFMKNGYLD